MLYCAHFYYKHFILVNSDKTPSIKVCTVQHYSIATKIIKIIKIINDLMIYNNGQLNALKSKHG